MKNIDEKLLKIINENLFNENITEEMKDIDFREFGIDSLTFVKIVVSLEKEFNCEVPDSYLIIDSMNTVNKMKEVINYLCSGNVNFFEEI